MSKPDRYFLTIEAVENWAEVTKEDFVSSERAAGFVNTLGKPNEPGTGGFSGKGVRGMVVSPGGKLPESFIPLKEEVLKPLPPRLERMSDEPDSPWVFSFPKGSYEHVDCEDGHLAIILNAEHMRVWIRSASEHLTDGAFDFGLRVGGMIGKAAKGLFSR